VRVCAKQVVKLRVVAADCGSPPLSTALDLFLVVNHTLEDDDGVYSSYDGDDTAVDGRRRRASDPTNIVLVGAACGSGLVMCTAILTAVVFALRSQRRRRHGRRHGRGACCCCCWCDSSNHGTSYTQRHRFLPSLFYRVGQKIGPLCSIANIFKNACDNFHTILAYFNANWP